MAYHYRDKRTSFNGVYNWIQEKLVLPNDPNKQVSYMGQICRDYLTQNNLPVRIKKDIWSIDKNCKTIQTSFQKFVSFVLNNEKYQKK